MTIIEIILTTAGTIICFLMTYFFRKIDSKLDNFMYQSNENKSNIGVLEVKAAELRESNNYKMDEIKSEMLELTKDIRSMVRIQTELIKKQTEHSIRITNLEEYVKGGKG